jgi:hypothetical protein
LLAGQHQDVHNSFAAEACGNLEAFTGDNLVDPPSKVCTVLHHNIPYFLKYPVPPHPIIQEVKTLKTF